MTRVSPPSSTQTAHARTMGCHSHLQVAAPQPLAAVEEGGAEGPIVSGEDLDGGLRRVGGDEADQGAGDGETLGVLDRRPEAPRDGQVVLVRHPE